MSAAVATASLATELPEITFDTGLPGFPDVHRFALVPWGGASSPFSLLRSLENAELAFVVVPPQLFFPAYEPEIDDATADRLGIGDADDALVLVVVTVGDEPSDATANLLGPLVINRHSRAAAQVVLSNGGFELRTPLV